jgi:antitoxin component of MazEF toxin-antitoxin module
MLERKVRRVGSSLVITLPSHLAEAYGITEGMMLSIRPIAMGKITLEKVNTPYTQTP